MIRRIDARISSIEGSWTFAGCVISDSTSSTRFTPSATGFAGFGYAGRDFHRTSLTCPQIKHRSTHRAGSRPLPRHRSVTEASWSLAAKHDANRSVACEKGMSSQHLIASNAGAPMTRQSAALGIGAPCAKRPA
jgi:hypothetical protein